MYMCHVNCNTPNLNSLQYTQGLDFFAPRCEGGIHRCFQSCPPQGSNVALVQGTLTDLTEDIGATFSGNSLPAQYAIWLKKMAWKKVPGKNQ